MQMQCGETNQQWPPPLGASLPPDMLANIHGRLSLLDRLSFAAVFHTSRATFKPEAPWLVLPGNTPETATLFSLSDRGAATARAPWADHVVLGSSSRCWLVTADEEARLRLVNPVTGERCTLPAITTIPCLIEEWGGFTMVEQKEFLRGPPYPGGGDRRPVGRTYTIRADLMRHFFYRKVVVSDSAAMLITTPQYGVPAFATAEGGEWRLAPSRDGVEDAIYYNGKFYSITYTGAVEAWDESPDASGVFTSTVVAPRLPNADGDPWSCRKYLVAAPGGKLMVVLEDSKETTDDYYGRLRTCSFKVQILDADGEQWKETDDIGDAALFVGVNSSTCVSTREHPEIRAGCVYYTVNDVGLCNDAYDQSGVGVFNLKDGRAEKVQGLGEHRNWPPPAWFIPSINDKKI